MPVANNLQEAKEFIVENVWSKYLTPALIASSMATWINGLQTNLDRDKQEQNEALGWVVPSRAIPLPSAVLTQNDDQVASVIDVVSRTIERLENVQSLTAPQTAAIIAAYNAAWA